MKVVCVNYTFSRSLTDPDVLLDRYETLVGWADGLKSAGASVAVIQRFGANATRSRHDISYRFVADPSRKDGSLFDRATSVNAAVDSEHPDLVHINGLPFARQASRLKRVLNVPFLIQDHAGLPPRRWLARRTIGRALQEMDAVSFVSREQARPWLDAGLLQGRQRIVELMEGSSRFVLKSREAARAQTGLTGDPLCLWVGRLDANKDPITVLRGFATALPTLPRARLAMVYSADALLPEVRGWLAQNSRVAGCVELLGQRPHDALEDFFNSADLFVLGSHHESAGYSVLEALACGVTPIVTNIPSFRVLTGEGKMGALWPVEDSGALAQALVAQQSRLHPESRKEIRTFFDDNFHWNQIGRQALEVYQALERGGGVVPDPKRRDRSP